jgi:hypothetical protein
LAKTLISPPAIPSMHASIPTVFNNSDQAPTGHPLRGVASHQRWLPFQKEFHAHLPPHHPNATTKSFHPSHDAGCLHSASAAWSHNRLAK